MHDKVFIGFESLSLWSFVCVVVGAVPYRGGDAGRSCTTSSEDVSRGAHMDALYEIRALIESRSGIENQEDDVRDAFVDALLEINDRMQSLEDPLLRMYVESFRGAVALLRFTERTFLLSDLEEVDIISLIAECDIRVRMCEGLIAALRGIMRQHEDGRGSDCLVEVEGLIAALSLALGHDIDVAKAYELAERDYRYWTVHRKRKDAFRGPLFLGDYGRFFHRPGLNPFREMLTVVERMNDLMIAYAEPLDVHPEVEVVDVEHAEGDPLDLVAMEAEPPQRRENRRVRFTLPDGSS